MRLPFAADIAIVGFGLNTKKKQKKINAKKRSFYLCLAAVAPSPLVTCCDGRTAKRSLLRMTMMMTMIIMIIMMIIMMIMMINNDNQYCPVTCGEYCLSAAGGEQGEDLCWMNLKMKIYMDKCIF